MVCITWDGKTSDIPRVSFPLKTVETVDCNGQMRFSDSDINWHNRLIEGDNKDIMLSLLEEFAGKIDLIYIDPPFATGVDRRNGDGSIAYRDTWGKGLDSYLQMIYERLTLMRDLLSESGSIYVHIGPNVSHYVRLMADEVFGRANSNEIIWRRAFGHSDSRRYGVIHDAILFYSKGNDWTWNDVRHTPDKNYIDRFFDQYDEQRKERYQRISLSAGGLSGGGYEYEYKGVRTLWRCPIETLKKHDEAGRLHWPKKNGGVPRLKRFESEYEGAPLQDIWNDISKIHNQSSELTGYGTQKPQGLLERILRVSSNEGDLVADLFCGSGTTAAVAEKLNRRWIMADLSQYAIRTTRKRLLNIDDCKSFKVQNLGKYKCSTC